MASGCRAAGVIKSLFLFVKYNMVNENRKIDMIKWNG